MKRKLNKEAIDKMKDEIIHELETTTMKQKSL